MKNKISITIGIPAYNEEDNIGKLLDSIISQKGSRYNIEKIIVACDGCTDKTAEIVEKYIDKHNNIYLINDGLRLGQAGRLNEFYKINKSDIFITFDADTVLGHRYVVNEIAECFEDKKVGLVGGADTPASAKSFVQKIANIWVDAWYEMRSDYNNGVTVHNHKGCVSAGKKEFLKKITIKNNVVGNDDFLYFSAKRMGYKFKFARKTIVYYKTPSGFEDYFQQTTRFLSAKHKVASYFGDWVYAEYKLPVLRKIRGLMIEFLKEPVFLPIAVLFQVLLRIIKYKYQEDFKNGLWIRIASTK